MSEQIYHASDHADEEIEFCRLPQGGLEVAIYSATNPDIRSVQLDAERVEWLYEALGDFLAAKSHVPAP